MIVRQVNPWSLGWTSPTTFAQMRRDMENLMERLAGVTADGSVAGVFPPMNVSEGRATIGRSGPRARSAAA